MLANLLRRYGEVFSKDSGDIGRTSLVEHSIPVVEGTRPIRQPPHRLGPHKEAEAERQVQDLLTKGLIEPSSGAWSAPVVLVRKKDNSWRFCIDYRRLNAVTQQDAYPIPRIDESLDALAGSRHFSTLDLTSGYWQVPLDPDAQEKAAFATRSGLWKWKVLPFGLTSAPATFQRLMEKVLHGLHWKTLLLYLDDIIIIAPDFQTHLERLEDVLKRLQGAGLKLKPEKCELLQEKVKYLGHVVSKEGVATDPDKVADIKKWHPPRTLKELQAFLGTAGYYRQYLKDYATSAKPLTRLTTKETPWEWDAAAQEAFETLKEGLVTAPVLGYPDPAIKYILDTDASAVGVGAVLSQIQEGNERVIAYYSKTLGPAERNYCVTRRELLAVIKAVKHFRPYLYGQTFRLRTDHASLRWLCRRKEPSCQVARWLEILSEFPYLIEHRAGPKHGNADGLSRKGWCEDCKQCRAIEQRDGGPTHLEVQQELEAEQTGPTQREPTRVNLILTDIVEDQKQGFGPVACIYRAVQSGAEPSRRELDTGGVELKQLYQRKAAMNIREDGLLEIRIAINGKSRKCVVCPPIHRGTVLWETHRMVHAGIHRTLGRLQLTWYWPGMTADVRRTIRTCEVCQVAKQGGCHPPGSRQRLYAGRPWQKVAVDLVGPFPVTPRGNRWILVLADHFTRWHDALPIPDATAPTVATTLDERVFSYMGLPEQIHTDQGVQFQSQLMAELCTLWGVEKTHTTPYHPQSNGIVERNNRTLGDALRTLLLRRGPEEWDLLLPQIMRAFRATPHSATKETPNALMLGRELRLPDQLMINPPTRTFQDTSEYVQTVHRRLEEAHDALRDLQWEVQQEDAEEPTLFKEGDLVLLENKRRRKGENPKLQAKFVGPYTIIKAFANHTYEIEKQGQRSVQSERRLKIYIPCTEATGQAPGRRELPLRPNMRGTARRNRGKGPPPPPENVEHEITTGPRDIQQRALENLALDTTRRGEDPPPGWRPPPELQGGDNLEEPPLELPQEIETAGGSLTQDSGIKEQEQIPQKSY